MANHTTKNEDETSSLAQKLADQLEPGDIVFLKGDLGAGKTVFARSLIRAMSGDSEREVPSPTFTLLQTYDSDKGEVYHFDLYRIENMEEIYELGWEDALDHAIILIEWPERLDQLAPEDRLDVRLSPSDENSDWRDITFEPWGSWKEKWKAL